eukprot:TRINITY_DN18028_c0_g1_i2.p1 TRINITY_DN18028_c0_g1~~TRINITY_DN18028_c0_g1_i2.p1  ORF type:complete len:697 (+),score=187.15 TRINITY_DN18028_c0_g1_i2:83-2173(+)
MPLPARLGGCRDRERSRGGSRPSRPQSRGDGRRCAGPRPPTVLSYRNEEAGESSAGVIKKVSFVPSGTPLENHCKTTAASKALADAGLESETDFVNMFIGDFVSGLLDDAAEEECGFGQEVYCSDASDSEEEDVRCAGTAAEAALADARTSVVEAATASIPVAMPYAGPLSLEDDEWDEVIEEDSPSAGLSKAVHGAAALQLISDAFFTAVDHLDDQSAAALLGCESYSPSSSSSANARAMVSSEAATVASAPSQRSLSKASSDFDVDRYVAEQEQQKASFVWTPSSADVAFAAQLVEAELQRRRAKGEEHVETDPAEAALERLAASEVDDVVAAVVGGEEVWEDTGGEWEGIMDFASQELDDILEAAVEDFAGKQVREEEAAQRQATGHFAAAEIEAILTASLQSFCSGKARDYVSRQRPLSEAELAEFWGDFQEEVDSEEELERSRLEAIRSGTFQLPAPSDAEIAELQAPVQAVAAVAENTQQVAAIAAESESAAAAPPPSRAGRTKRRTIGKASRRSIGSCQTIRLDIDEGESKPRENSLARAYAGLGAEIFSMQEMDEKSHSPSPWSRHLERLGAEAAHRAPSGAGAQLLRQSSASALMMDLGLAPPSSSSSSAPSPSSRALKVSKSTGMLPALPSKAARFAGSTAQALQLQPFSAKAASGVDRAHLAWRAPMLARNDSLFGRPRFDMGVF